MKKVILSISLMSGILLASCNKEETCNCGTIKDDAIEFDASGNMYYTLTVESECSGVNKKVYVDYSYWLDSPVGGYTCVTGVGDWMPTQPITNTQHPYNKQL